MKGKGNGRPGKRGVRLRTLDLLLGDRTGRVAIPVLAILLSMIVGAVLLLLLGKEPFTALSAFLRGSGFLPKPSYAGGQGMLTDLLSFLGILAPMMLAALAVIVALKCGMFNIGIAGMMLAAGFTATVLVGYSGLDAYLAKPLVMLIGLAVGGSLGALVGFLKYRFNIHEVVSTIMFNYIINYVVGFFINSSFADTITRTSKICSPASRFTLSGIMIGGMKATLPLGILLALLCVFLVRFLLERTVLGFEFKAIGLNKRCAKYAGMRVGRNTVLAMCFSGMLAGLAGVTFYLGYYNTIVPKELAGLGYDAIAVALLGNTGPVGSIFSSILVTIFQRGSVYMSSTTGVPKEIASVITGIMLLFSACGEYIRYLAGRKRDQIEDAAARRGRSSGANLPEKEGVL